MIKKIINNVYLFSLLSKIFGVASGFAYSILLSRYLGASLRGEVSIVQNYVSIAAVILCWGIYQAYPYYKKRAKTEDRRKLYLEFTNLSFALFLIYFGICLVMLTVLDLTWTIKMAVFLVSFEFLIKQLNFFVLIDNPRLRNIASMALSLFDVVFVAALFIMTDANYMYTTIFLIAKELFYLYLAVSNLHIRLKEFRPYIPKEALEYIKFGILPMITTLMLTINYKMDVIMLQFFKVSTEDIGVYSLGVMLAEKIWLIPDALKDILLSRLANGKGEKEVAQVSRISALATLACIIGVVIVGKPLIVFAYGKEYANAYSITTIILFGVLAMVFYKMIYSYNVINKKQSRNFILLAISAIANIILNAIMIPVMGDMGAGVASLLSYLLCGALFVITFSKDTKIRIHKILFVQKEDCSLIVSMFRKK